MKIAGLNSAYSNEISYFFLQFKGSNESHKKFIEDEAQIKMVIKI